MNKGVGERRKLSARAQRCLLPDNPKSVQETESRVNVTKAPSSLFFLLYFPWASKQHFPFLPESRKPV